jgi:hypothetical protein
VVVWKNGWLQAPIACDSDAWGDRILIAGDTALSGSVPGQGAITVDTSDLAPQLSIVGLGQGLFVDLPFEFSSSIGGEVTLLSLRDPYGENVILYDLAYSGGATVSANTSGMDSGWCTLTMRVVKNGIRYTTNQEVFFRQVAIGGIEEWGYYYPEDLPLTVFANIRTADSYTLWLFDDYDPGDPGVELSALPGEPYAFQLTSITLGSRQNCRLELEVTRDGATVSSTLYFDYYPEGGY